MVIIIQQTWQLQRWKIPSLTFLICCLNCLNLSECWRVQDSNQTNCTFNFGPVIITFNIICKVLNLILCCRSIFFSLSKSAISANSKHSQFTLNERMGATSVQTAPQAWAKTLLVWNGERVGPQESQIILVSTKPCTNVNWLMSGFYYEKRQLFWRVLEYNPLYVKCAKVGRYNSLLNIYFCYFPSHHYSI